MKLLHLSLVISILGILILLLIPLLVSPTQVSNKSNLVLGDYVKTSGKIVSIKTYEDFSIIRLDNNITLTCDSCLFQKFQTITVEGKVTDYQDELQIQADRIKLSN